MQAALDINLPNCASLVTTKEVVDSLPSVKAMELSAP